MSSLYDFVKGLMAREHEPFSLSFSSAKGPVMIPKTGNSPKLISGLGMAASVLINVVWEDGASSEAKSGKGVLKEEYRNKATQIEVQEPDATEIDDKEDAGAKPIGTSPKAKGKGGVPKWFKMGGKK